MPSEQPLIFLIKKFLLEKRVVTDDGHWLLKNSKQKEYPQIKFCGIQYGITTLSAIAFLELKLNNNFNIPEGINICHKNICHNPACFNPDHIYIGTPLTNCLDQKGIDGSIEAEKIFLARIKKESQVEKEIDWSKWSLVDWMK